MRRGTPLRIMAILCAAGWGAAGWGAAGWGAAQGGEPPGPPGARPWAVSAERVVWLFPQGDVYPHYVADAHRRAFGIKLLGFSGTDIPDSSASRLQTKLGGRIGLARAELGGAPWQLSFETGFDGQFDNRRRQDGIGWDGYYGVLATGRLRPDWGLKLGAMHLSSHVGDEYMQRVGRQRVEYTREELVAGVAYLPGRWQTYIEAGWAYELRVEDVQDHWRLQGGAQYHYPLPLAGLSWYAGTDVSAYQERDWRRDFGVQIGLALDLDGRVWRLGLEYYDGRPTIGEFYQHTERHIALVLLLDLL